MNIYDSAMEDVRFILLMRHAKHTAVGTPIAVNAPECHVQEIASALRKLTNTPIPVVATPPQQTAVSKRRELSDEGREETKTVGERLKEHTEEWREPFTLAGIITADSDEAQATAMVMRQEFSDAKFEPVEFLTPRNAFNTPAFKREGASALAEVLKNQISDLATRLVDGMSRSFE